jgi:hypothetical protein
MTALFWHQGLNKAFSTIEMHQIGPIFTIQIDWNRHIWDSSRDGGQRLIRCPNREYGAIP